jgi:hypothetical protein
VAVWTKHELRKFNSGLSWDARMVHIKSEQERMEGDV